MRRVISIPLILTVTTSAMADWSKLTSTEQGAHVYIDVTTIRRSKDVAKMWSMLDFKEPQVVSGTSFRSSRAQKEYDCENETSRMLSMSFHSDKLGLGKTVHTDSVPKLWAPVSPTSIESELFDYVCKTSIKSVRALKGSESLPGWKRAHVTPKATVFYDPKSIQRRNGMAKMLVLTNFAQPMLIEGKHHQSAKAQFEYDCIKERSRVDGSYYYGLPDGKGATTATESASKDWYSVVPKTLGRILWNIACGK